ncbi:MAG: hypothetical protein KBA95_04745, partial [Acidobacteria bacterium]|nr:hypothetical protein [Acidobacteriota bacterium]
MRLVGGALVVFLGAMAYAISGDSAGVRAQEGPPGAGSQRAIGVRDGREIFRFDTFGDEQLWTGFLRMHEVLPTVDPETALA